MGLGRSVRHAKGLCCSMGDKMGHDSWSLRERYSGLFVGCLLNVPATG